MNHSLPLFLLAPSERLESGEMLALSNYHGPWGTRSRLTLRIVWDYIDSSYSKGGYHHRHNLHRRSLPLRFVPFPRSNPWSGGEARALHTGCNPSSVTPLSPSACTYGRHPNLVFGLSDLFLGYYHRMALWLLDRLFDACSRWAPG